MFLHPLQIYLLFSILANNLYKYHFMFLVFCYIFIQNAYIVTF